MPGVGLSYGMTTVDTTDPRGLAGFWAAALETDAVQEHGEDGDLVMLSTEGGVRLGFQRVAEPTPGKNRVHLDFGAVDLSAEVERLTGLGAVLVAERSMPGVEWVVLADPAGNQFCVTGRG
ncbi:VOC family protein [Actinosynnema pretiosum subsp. pretiosum]